MSLAHDPLGTELTCPACLSGKTGYDHDAVRRARPDDFDRQLEHLMRQIARGMPAVAGYTLHTDAPRRAQRWLREQVGR